KSRFKATEAELPILSAVFEKNPFPSAVLRQKLADRLGLESKQIQFWFQNRRATLK
ncbi:homeobox domain-containing protein, partial [Chytriomyces cf. hyalinus JEL632]